MPPWWNDTAELARTSTLPDCGRRQNFNYAAAVIQLHPFKQNVIWSISQFLSSGWKKTDESILPFSTSAVWHHLFIQVSVQSTNLGGCCEYLIFVLFIYLFINRDKGVGTQWPIKWNPVVTGFREGAALMWLVPQHLGHLCILVTYCWKCCCQ